MKFLYEGDIFQMGFTLLQFLGENMYYTPKIILVYRLVNCMVKVLIIVFVFANFFYVSGGLYVNTSESLMTVCHALIKYSLFIYHKKTLGEILREKTEKFWDRQICNKSTIREIRSMYKLVKFVQVVSLYSLLFCLYIIWLKPLFNADHVFLLDTTVFVDSLALETLVLACQYYFFYIIIAVIFGYDVIYISLCVEVSAQVEVLKYRLREMFGKSCDDLATIKQLGECIEHHTFLLSIYERMTQMYSIMLLFHYFVSLTTACLDMYESFVGRQDLASQILKYISLTCIIGQFALYALPAELLTSEFADISYAIYMSKWYYANVKIQKLMVLIIARSQRMKCFSAAGFIDINVDAFGSIIRRTFSFYAVIRNLLEK